MDYAKKFSTESKIDQYARKGIRIGINKSFESGIDITAQGIFRKIDYQDYNALLGKTRKDNEQKYLFTFAIPKFKFYDIVPSINFIHTNHQSNVEMLYRYKQNEVVLKFEKNF